MKILPKKNKNGYPVERFFKIVRTLPPVQCQVLGELLQEFGKWLVYDSQLKTTKLIRTNGDISKKYKDVNRCISLIYDKGYTVENATQVVF